MKKFFIALLTAVCALCTALGLAACNNPGGESDTGWGNEYTVTAAYAKAVELGYDKSLEEFISTISGKDGADGVGISSAVIDGDGSLL